MLIRLSPRRTVIEIDWRETGPNGLLFARWKTDARHGHTRSALAYRCQDGVIPFLAESAGLIRLVALQRSLIPASSPPPYQNNSSTHHGIRRRTLVPQNRNMEALAASCRSWI